MFVPLGMGLIIGAILMNIHYKSQTNINIEEKARALGMVYPYELKVIDDEGEVKND